MNYLVIDLEMCNVPKDYRSRSYKYANETIQIGAVLLDDAVNTGYLIEKLEMNPEYKLVSYEMPEQEQGHLSCTLGELFTGLELKLA